MFIGICWDTICQKLPLSIGFFDKEDHYIELYIFKDSIFVCNAAIPILHQYKLIREKNMFQMKIDSISNLQFRLNVINKNQIEIITKEDTYIAYKLREIINPDDYYANQIELREDFYRNLWRREMRIKTLNNPMLKAR